MQPITRNIDAEEQQKLADYVKSVEDRSKGKFNGKWLIVFLVITLLSAIHIIFRLDSEWRRLSVAAGIFGVIGIWTILENLIKKRKTAKKELPELLLAQIGSKVNVISITASRVIQFEEYEDEGELYLIETPEGECFYLWDWLYTMVENSLFPSSQFEIFVEGYIHNAFDTNIKILGDPISPIMIKGKIKWDYFEKEGFPEPLEKLNKSFDEILEELKMGI
ncbi:MAG: hypothetical protein AB8F95_17255 [Bacteroidia bacterium]